MKKNFMEKVVKDPHILLDRQYSPEWVRCAEEMQQTIWDLYVMSKWNELSELLQQESSVLNFASQFLKVEDETHYAVLCVGRLLGTTESFEQLLYERSQDQQVCEQFDSALRQMAHLRQVIQALESHGEMTHKELCEVLGLNASTLTEAMKKILETGLIAARNTGRYKLYRLTDSGLRLGREFRRSKPAEASVTVRPAGKVRIALAGKINSEDLRSAIARVENDWQMYLKPKELGSDEKVNEKSMEPVSSSKGQKRGLNLVGSMNKRNAVADYARLRA